MPPIFLPFAPAYQVWLNLKYLLKTLASFSASRSGRKCREHGAQLSRELKRSPLLSPKTTQAPEGLSDRHECLLYCYSICYVKNSSRGLH